MQEKFRALVRWLYVIAVSMALGAVISLIFFFGSNFLIAPQDIDAWIELYFEQHDGAYFLISVILAAAFVIPFTKKLKIV